MDKFHKLLVYAGQAILLRIRGSEKGYVLQAMTFEGDDTVKVYIIKEITDSSKELGELQSLMSDLIFEGVEKLISEKKDVVTEHDAVNRPSHYTDGKIEVIDFIEDKKLGFCLGNAVKYISRAGKKDAAKHKEDLMKARWYLDREISKLE